VTPYFAAALVGVAVLALFMAAWRMAPRRDPVMARLTEYGEDGDLAGGEDAAIRKRGRFPLTQRLVNGFGLGPKLALALSRADLALTAAEFIMIVLLIFVLGVVLGTLRANLLVGIGLGALLAFVPFVFLRVRQTRRLNAFTRQLPDMLTLLVGALRAGYGLNQALSVLVEQLPAPTSVEIGRVLHAVNLGVPVTRALASMAKRVGSDDLDLVVTAITVQYELGGNLAAVLESISATVRGRLHLFREVKVLTAQQRFTGYILALFPVFLVVALSLIRPGFFAPFFEPGLIRLLPLFTVVMMVVGFFMIRRIVDIKV
jgi:tight adherence protein B